MEEMKYFFISNVRIGSDVSTQIVAFDTQNEAEIKYHDEISYGLKLDTIVLANYMVVNEFGSVVGDLHKVINNIPAPEPPEV